MREILRQTSLPAGDFLFGISPAGCTLDAASLRHHVVTVLDRCRGKKVS